MSLRSILLFLGQFLLWHGLAISKSDDGNNDWTDQALQKIVNIHQPFITNQKGNGECNHHPGKASEIDIDDIILQCEEQITYALKQAVEHKEGDKFLPRALDDGKIVMVSPRDWTSGFFPGSLWYMYELTGNKCWRKRAAEVTHFLEDQQFNTGTHDVGFMMYCSYGNGLRLTEKKKYGKILLQSSKSLITRFNGKVGCIRSWDHNADLWQFPVIIDNMMNLEMLCWASRYSGNDEYLEIAKKHADTTLKNHFREDNSSFHVVDYNPVNGAVRSRVTNQGYADGSAWARGQAWGLYGYTLMYRETGDQRYLDQAEKIAQFILTHPNLPADKVPYWDYNAPSIPNAPRDASAAAITASALFELGTISNKKDFYHSSAEQIMASLCSPEYLAKPGTNHGFLLKHSTGNMPINKEIDVPIN